MNELIGGCLHKNKIHFIFNYGRRAHSLLHSATFTSSFSKIRFFSLLSGLALPPFLHWKQSFHIPERAAQKRRKIIWLIFPWGRPAGKFKSNLSFSLRGPLVHRQIKLSFTNSNLKVFIYSPSLILVSVLTVNTVTLYYWVAIIDSF